LVLAMTSRSYGCAVVLNGDNRLLGLVTDGDLRRHMTKVGTLTGRTADLMTTQPRTIKPNSLAAEAVALMNDNRITSLLVFDEQRLVGLIHLHDCLRQGVA
jgi:arabinose-5-phosphate isomerase